MPNQERIVVAILGEDQLVGRALGLLLRGTGWNVRFLGEPVVDKLGELLAGAQLLILTPTKSADHRENLIDGLKGEPATATMPVLELITTLDVTRNGYGRHVMWPCRIDELVREIRDALLASGRLEHPANEASGR